MLTALTIQNVVLIDRLALEFRAGFCALTGETGAGKSILLDSLGLALGARAETRLVRKGAEQAQVTATFEIPASHPAFSVLQESEIMVEQGEPLVVRRSLSADGRSKAFINDQPVSAGLLRTVGESLVEIHGQFETQGLLDPKTHRGMLDEYAGVNTAELRGHWDAWKTAEEKLSAEREAMDRARRDEEYLRQAVEDLDALAPEQGEEEKLAHLRERLMKREQILEALNVGYEGVNEAENVLGQAARALERAGDDGADIMAALDRAGAELQEALSAIQSLSADLEECEYSLSEIDDRLFALRAQARKHDCTVDDLPRIRDELAAQLNNIERQDDILAELMKETDALKKAYMSYAEDVRGQRQQAAGKLDGFVADELPPLKLEKALFVTKVESLEEGEWGPGGMDRVRFLVATNPGTEPGPLNKIASGGEMARFMLALKVVMAETGTAGTMIFDEVDSGIGGATADAVGERLARLAASRQILVVTHAPQVAARAGHHYIVMKDGGDDVKTTVIHLEETPARREEIARMLSGASITDESRAAADKLLETGRAA
ncbi:MAG: DNA repair protein RecN [Rhodospirillales bacterium]|nr:DNA repair protein RecN [Rhodospirillales bacterium]